MTCPNCERYKASASMWRNKAYEASGKPLPWKPDEFWVGLNPTEIENIYWEVLKEWRGGHLVQGQIAFAQAIQAALKEKNT